MLSLSSLTPIASRQFLSAKLVMFQKGLGVAGAKEHQADFLEGLIGPQKLFNASRGHSRRFTGRISVDTRRDGGERYGVKTALNRKTERAGIACRQQISFVLPTPPVHGTDGMDYMFRSHPSAGRDNGLAGRQTVGKSLAAD